MSRAFSVLTVLALVAGTAGCQQHFGGPGMMAGNRHHPKDCSFLECGSRNKLGVSIVLKDVPFNVATLGNDKFTYEPDANGGGPNQAPYSNGYPGNSLDVDLSRIDRTPNTGFTYVSITIVDPNTTFDSDKAAAFHTEETGDKDFFRSVRFSPDHHRLTFRVRKTRRTNALDAKYSLGFTQNGRPVLLDPKVKNVGG